jgi:hypothetical protein
MNSRDRSNFCAVRSRAKNIGYLSQIEVAIDRGRVVFE